MLIITLQMEVQEASHFRFRMCMVLSDPICMWALAISCNTQQGAMDSKGSCSVSQSSVNPWIWTRLNKHKKKYFNNS